MKISKKILLSLGVLASTVFGLFMNATTVKAENYTGQAIWPSEYISNIYIRKDRPDGYSKYQQARFIRRSEDNKFVYCLQPYVEIDNNYVYKVARSDYETYLNMTKEQFDRSLKGVGVPNLHLGEIQKVKIIVPPIELQNQFADIVKQIDKQKFESVIKAEKEIEKIQKNTYYKWGR